MPTPGGLPKAGEVWELALPLDEPRRFVVIMVGDPPLFPRSRADNWSLRIWTPARGREVISPAYYWAQGYAGFIGMAGPKTRKRAGL